MFSKDIDIEQKLMAKIKIPILIKDKDWLKLFGDIGDRSINNFRKELEKLLENQLLTDKILKEKKIEKKKEMSKIIVLSDEINNNNNHKESSDLLGQYQQDIYILNDEIDKLTYESEVLPKEIREANFRLIKATVKLAYKQLAEWESSMEPYNLEIENLRNKLRELIEEKNDKEEKINITYRFLHGILGSEEMEKLDKDMLD